MEAEHFTRRRDSENAAWRVIQGLGRSGDSVTVFPATVPSRTEPAAIRAHEAAHCAGEQDKYWEMHRRLFGPASTHTPERRRHWLGARR